jgi:Txe/YoeB family toxin of toxin-antitoxin system
MSALYEVRFTISADKDYEFLQENNIKLFDKVNEMLKYISYNIPPYKQYHPEKLVGNYSGCMSMRITQKHRLIFSIDKNIIVV